MSIASLILGESGTGKTTSLRNLEPIKTLLIQSIKKPLPFRAAGWKLRTKGADGKNHGNIIVTENSQVICELLRRSTFPVIVIDDFQYVLANEFMRRSTEKGFEKFTEIGRHAWDILSTASDLSPEKRVYILSHTTSDEAGRTRMKTIGKMLDEKITPEGMFTMVLKTTVSDGNYYFSTQNSGSDTTKSPMGMFGDSLIHNDLAAVDDAICEFYEITSGAPA